MKKYKLGIIGAGMYGKVLMRCFRQDRACKDRLGQQRQ